MISRTEHFLKTTTALTQQPGTHIVWDWNGTLKDDVHDLLGATNSALVRLGGRPIDTATYRALHCAPLPDFYARVLGRTLTSAEWATAETHFMRYLSHRPVRLREGAAALLTQLRERGYSQSLLSLLPHDRLMSETAEAGIADVFDRIDGRRSAGTTKAQALAIHLNAIDRPLDGAHVLLIGDTRDDALAAHAVGARVVLVTGGLEDLASPHQDGVPVADSLTHALSLGLHSPQDPPVSAAGGERTSTVSQPKAETRPCPGPRPGPAQQPVTTCPAPRRP